MPVSYTHLEVWRHALNKISQDKRNSNYIIAELVIPPEVGGFWMRELGLYDDAGTLIAVANMAESYKPALAEGSGRSQTCRMVIIVSSVTSVELTIDTTTVMATQDYVCLLYTSWKNWSPSGVPLAAYRLKPVSYTHLQGRYD